MLEFRLLSINMWSIWLWVFPSGEVQVYLRMFRWGNIVLFTTRFFDVAKVTILTPLSILCWCKLSFPIVGLKIFSLPTFTLKSPNRIFVWLKTRLEYVIYTYLHWHRSRWSRGLRRRCAAARLLRLWFRIPPGAWTFVCYEFCVCCQVEVSATS